MSTFFSLQEHELEIEISKRISIEKRILLQIEAVEMNDLSMLEFLRNFRQTLESEDATQLQSTIFSDLLKSLELVFKNCNQPAASIQVEVSNADFVTAHLDFMRKCLLGRAFPTR